MTAFTWIDKDGLKYVIEVFDNGHLHCASCVLNWCPHIEGAVRSHADSPSIFAGIDPYTDYMLEVPVFPTAIIWQRVTLAPYSATAFKIFFRQRDDQHDIEPYFLGFLNLGEGRLIIRSMLLDWFEGMVEVKGLRCPSASHKFKQEMAWQNAMKDPVKAIVQYWAVWRYGACFSCMVSLASGDPDDLIPDDSSSRRKVF